MKHYTISLLAVFLGMLAVLDGAGSLSNLGNRSAVAEQEEDVPAAVMSGTGVVEEIQVRRVSDDTDHSRALLGKLMLDAQPQSVLSAGKVYSIRVRMGDGMTQTVLQDSAAGLQVGERVRLDSGRVYRS
jgi:hypothetical protein